MVIFKLAMLIKINPNSKSVSCQDPSSPAGSGAAAAKHQRPTHNFSDGDVEPATMLANQQKNKKGNTCFALCYASLEKVCDTLAKMLVFC